MATIAAKKRAAFKRQEALNRVAARVVNKSQEEDREDGKECRDPAATEEYEREARTLIVSMRVYDSQQVEDTEKLIVELSTLLQ
jgi:hypothetical protein